MPLRKKPVGRPRKRKQPFTKLRRGIYGKRRPRLFQDRFNVKRIVTGRLMTLNNVNSSAGASSFVNGGNNMLTCNTPAGSVSYHAFAFAFALTDIPNVTEFSNLFDSYRFNCVMFRLYPLVTESSAGSASTGYGPSGWIHSIIDYDDYTATTASDIGVDELRQYASYRVQNMIGRRPLKRKIYPKVAVGARSSTGYDNSLQLRKRFIDTDNTGTIHYGFKMVVEIYNPTNAQLNTYWKLEPIYYLSFKNVR